MTKWKIYVSGMEIKISYDGGEVEVLEATGLFDSIEMLYFSADVSAYRVVLNGRTEVAAVVLAEEGKHQYMGAKGISKGDAGLPTEATCQGAYSTKLRGVRA